MIPVEELLAWPALVGATEADLDTLEAMERAAVSLVEIQTGRYFGLPETVTEYVRGHGGRQLWLRDVPVGDAYDGAPEVTVIERALPGDTGTTLDESSVAVRVVGHEARLIRADTVWLLGYEYEVGYLRGYWPGEEPTDVRQLVLDLVALRWQMRGDESLRSETIGGYSYTRTTATDVTALPGGADVIAAWRRPVFA